MHDETGRPPSTPTAGAGAGESATAPGPAQIAEEHRRLRELLGRVKDARDLGSLLPLLGELRAELVEHFAHEEAAGGLHDVIDDAAPHLLERVHDLFDEHRRCLDDLDRLSERVRKILEGPVTELLRDADRLCATLHEHEAAETELLSGALYDEIGGSG